MTNVVIFKNMLERVIRRARKASHSHKLAERAFQQAGADPDLLKAFSLITHYYDALEAYTESGGEVPELKRGVGRPKTGAKNVRELINIFLKQIVPKWVKPRKTKPAPTPPYTTVFEVVEEAPVFTFDFGQNTPTQIPQPL